MSFKDTVTIALNRSNDEAVSLIKMLRSEKRKVNHFVSQIKKLTFNEVFTGCSLILLTTLGFIVSASGVYISTNSLLLESGGLGSAGVFIVSLLALISCCLTLKLLVSKFAYQIHDHFLVRAYTLNVKSLYKGLNSKILNHVEHQTNVKLGINSELMYIETEKYEDSFNVITSNMLKGLKSKDSKRFLRFYIYDRSHITNSYTQVLYIFSSTLTIYTYFLHNSNKLTTKDLLDISFKSICINK